jgi:TorA maturation chaperone TorD
LSAGRGALWRIRLPQQAMGPFLAILFPRFRARQLQMIFEPAVRPDRTEFMHTQLKQPTDMSVMTIPQDEHDGLRASVYGLLGHLLAKTPSPGLLKLLQESEDASPITDELAVAWRLLKVAARNSNCEALDDEYHKLFIGLGRGELVPYASWYLTGLLMDRPLVYLRRDLEMLGIERQPGGSEPEDHAAALCESMCVIIAASDIAFSTQKLFFLDHVASWMPVFFQDLQQAQSACLYAAVGGLGESFLNFESRYFDLEA